MEQAIVQTNDVVEMLKQNGFNPDFEMDQTLPHTRGFDLPRVRIEIKDNGKHLLYLDRGDSYSEDAQREEYLSGNKIEGVIIDSRRIRANWKQGETVPTCSSVDGIIKSDAPVADNCNFCPEAVIGKGNCKPKERLIMIAKIDDKIIPLIMALPPTSIKHFEAHKRRLMRSELPLIAVNSIMTLQSVKKGTYNWGEIEFSINGLANPQMLAVAKQAREELKRFTENIASSDYNEHGDKAA
jgi:hypothetical protein